jgi:hypothetical protein
VRCQLAAFFGLSLEENLFVEHGCLKRGRPLPRRPRRFGVLDVPQTPSGPSLRDAEILKVNCVHERANRCRSIETFGVLQVGHGGQAGTPCHLSEVPLRRHSPNGGSTHS